MMALKMLQQQLATLINHLDDVASVSLGSIQSALVEVSEHEDGRRTRLSLMQALHLDSYL